MEIEEIKQDNTKVYKTPILDKIKQKPTQYYIRDLGGTPSQDTRTSAERNKDYWHPIKGAKERFKSSMRNKTNPLVGIEKTILPAMAGAALATTPATVIGGAIGGSAVDATTGGWGKWLEDKTGIPEEIGVYTNPGAIYGGLKGYNITKNKLASKFIKGDSDLGWNPLNKNHWIFNKEVRTPTNIAMATINRVIPFLSNVEKTPARIAAYKIGKRTKGNASVSIKDIKANDSTYTGSATPEGNTGDRNLLGLYLFQNDPLINKSPWFQRIYKSFKPASKEGFKYSERYSELYPGVENRRYVMNSVVQDTRPLEFKSVKEFNEYSNGIGKIQGKEGDMVIETPMGFQTFRQPGTNYVGPIDDVGGHLVKIGYNNKGKLTQISQDIWKFNPADYAKRWSDNTLADAVRANKQAALMDKVGTPFILQQENPIRIGTRRVWESLESVPNIIKNRRTPRIEQGLLLMKKGGSLISDGRRFKFKDSPLVRNARTLNNKRDMRKKFIKSDRPTYSIRRVKKGQEGLKFVSYSPVSSQYKELNFQNVFSPYNIPVIQSQEVPVIKETKPQKAEEPQQLNIQEQPTITQPKMTQPKVEQPYKGKNQWANDLMMAYKRAGIKSENALKMLLAQDALESGWGKSAQGKFNYGNLTTGSKWKGAFVEGKDKDAKGNPISQKFRSYSSMDEYAKDKVQFLKSLYRFNENDDIDTFLSKLQGGKRKYAQSPKYSQVLKQVYESL